MPLPKTKNKKESVLTGKKRKKTDERRGGKRRGGKLLEGDVTSESEDDRREEDEQSDSEHNEEETANEKRTRLAKEMLHKIKERVSEEDVSSYLRQDLLEKTGRVFHETADQYEVPSVGEVRMGTWGRLKAVTCVVVTTNNKHIFSASKDGTIVKWLLPQCSKVGLIKKAPNPKNKKKEENSNKNSTTGHFGSVNALATSNNFLASGGDDKMVNLWHVTSLSHLHRFSGHRHSVMSLVLQGSTLYSGSKDRSIKVWNVSELAYVETLWGHEDQVCSMDASHQRLLSGGGRDSSVRLWKIPEESHLVFLSPLGCVDCVAFVDNKHFLSASNQNKIHLWSTDKKKPLFTIHDAHNNNINNNNYNIINGEKNNIINNNNNNNTTKTNDNINNKTNEGDLRSGGLSDKASCERTSPPPVNHPHNPTHNHTSTHTNNHTSSDLLKDTRKDTCTKGAFTSLSEVNEQWISSLSVLHQSNMFVTGSRDGLLRFWKISSGFKSLHPLFHLPLRGFINCLSFSQNFVVAAVAQEHRLGRWFKTDKTVKNCVCLIPLRKRGQEEEKEGQEEEKEGQKEEKEGQEEEKEGQKEEKEGEEGKTDEVVGCL